MITRMVLRSPLGVWAAAGAVVAVTLQLCIEYFRIFGLAPLVAWIAAGMVLVAAQLLRILLSTDRLARARSAAVYLAVVISALLLAWPLGRIGAWLTAHGRFALQHETYNSAISELQANPPLFSGPVQEHDAIVDIGPPLRVAFIWPGGVIDNWCGAVYDPTAEVLKANSFNGDWNTWYDQVPMNVIKLFGGDLLHCRTLSPPYFHCCFT